jgi:membrane protein DedA with SNARE-associated domain
MMYMQTEMLLAMLSLDATVIDFLRRIVEAPVEIFHGYTSLIRWVADSIYDLFESYGYWVIFLGTLAENTLFLGLIIPGLLVVVLAGLAAEAGAISFPLATALGIAGTIIGDTFSYFLGRFGWTRLGGSSLQEFAERVREPILRRGVLFVLIYHFAGYTRVVGPASAGILRMPFRLWAPADYAGASLWVTTYMAVGYALGMLGFSLDSTDDWFRYLEWGLLAIVLLWGMYVFRSGQQIFANVFDSRDEEPAGSIESRSGGD